MSKICPNVETLMRPHVKTLMGPNVTIIMCQALTHKYFDVSAHKYFGIWAHDKVGSGSYFFETSQTGLAEVETRVGPAITCLVYSEDSNSTFVKNQTMLDLY